MKTPTVLIAAAMLVAACATATPYAPSENPGRYGYSEQQLEDDRFRVSFSGNSFTNLTTVENYVLFRAAEVTLINGYDWFEVVGGANEANRQYRGFSSSFGARGGFNYAFVHPRFGAFGFNDPFFTDINIREIVRYDVSAEIVVGRGEKPSTPRAYSAQEVADNLDAFVTRPS